MLLAAGLGCCCSVAAESLGVSAAAMIAIGLNPEGRPGTGVPGAGCAATG